MSQQSKKTGPGEVKWPYKKFVIKGWDHGTLQITFNENQKQFDFDVIRLNINGEQIQISRDDLAQILIFGYDERKKYEEAMNLESKQLKNLDLDRICH